MQLSIITPMYNAMRFVDEAYASLLRQDATDWEWVIVDDGSTDGCYEHMMELAAKDHRLVVERIKHSGVAKTPRDHAAKLAHSPFVLMLDADDWLADGYITSMLRRQESTGADIVYPRVRAMADGREQWVLPSADFDMQGVIGGRDAVRLTIPDWKIGCNGGLYRREVWLSQNDNTDMPLINSDEVDERLYQLQAESIAFADVSYYYRIHAEATTKHFNPKVFHTLLTAQQLLGIISDTFGADSTEYRQLRKAQYHGWRHALMLYFKHYRELPNDINHIQGFILSSARSLGVKAYYLQYILHCLRHAPALLPEIIVARLFPLWHRRNVLHTRLEKIMVENIRKTYRDSRTLSADAAKAASREAVVSVFAGNHIGGGLIDRLRGIVCSYIICKQRGLDFRIHFVHPFNLGDYLVPAIYDWRIAPDEVSFTPDTGIMVIETFTNTIEEQQMQKRRLTKAFRGKATGSQLHVYSNANFCYGDGTFGSAFRELFTPSPRLQQRLDAIGMDISCEGYISVSARFQNLMGDFNEQNFSEPLPQNERQALLSRCLDALERIHRNHPAKRILVCSDSITFTHAAQCRDYVYVVEGVTTHIDNDAPESYEYYEKTFLDFYSIAAAGKSYLLLGGQLFNSGFPYAASLAGNHEFEIYKI